MSKPVKPAIPLPALRSLGQSEFNNRVEDNIAFWPDALAYQEASNDFTEMQANIALAAAISNGLSGLDFTGKAGQFVMVNGTEDGVTLSAPQLVSLSADAVVTPAQNRWVFVGEAPLNLSLPAPNSVPNGFEILVYANSGSVNIVGQLSGAANKLVGSGGYARVVGNGVDKYFVLSGGTAGELIHDKTTTTVEPWIFGIPVAGGGGARPLKFVMPRTMYETAFEDGPGISVGISCDNQATWLLPQAFEFTRVFNGGAPTVLNPPTAADMNFSWQSANQQYGETLAMEFDLLSGRGSTTELFFECNTKRYGSTIQETKVHGKVTLPGAAMTHIAFFITVNDYTPPGTLKSGTRIYVEEF